MARNQPGPDVLSEAYIEQLFAETDKLFGPSLPLPGCQVSAATKVPLPSPDSAPVPPPTSPEYDAAKFKERFEKTLLSARSRRLFAAAQGFPLAPNPLLVVGLDAGEGIKLSLPLPADPVNDMRIKGLLAPDRTRGEGMEVLCPRIGLNTMNRSWNQWLRDETELLVKNGWGIEGVELRFDYALLPDTGEAGAKINGKNHPEGLGRLLIILPSFDSPILKVEKSEGAGEFFTLKAESGGVTLAIWYHGAIPRISCTDTVLCLLYTVLPHKHHPSQPTSPGSNSRPLANRRLEQCLDDWKAAVANTAHGPVINDPECRRLAIDFALESYDKDLFISIFELFGAPPAEEMDVVAEGIRRFQLGSETAGKLLKICVRSQNQVKNKLRTVAKIFGKDSKALATFGHSILSSESLAAELRTADLSDLLPDLGINVLRDLLTVFAPLETTEPGAPIHVRAGAAFLGWGIIYMQDLDLGRRSGTVNPIRVHLLRTSYHETGILRLLPENAIRVSIRANVLPTPPSRAPPAPDKPMVSVYTSICKNTGSRFMVEAGNHRVVALDAYLTETNPNVEDRASRGWWLAEIYNADMIAQFPEVQRLVRSRERPIWVPPPVQPPSPNIRAVSNAPPVPLQPASPNIPAVPDAPSPQSVVSPLAAPAQGPLPSVPAPPHKRPAGEVADGVAPKKKKPLIIIDLVSDDDENK
ncbi:hypothetical protein FN846DRAFT_605200 [Sphaerosporella brunnea]|uniref:Uncharacterized protein n=1 Tax=Sphaerosporella brunnea TaxID=1250544 RepID=A0A5J5F183_9PEZI|nr:hypothetical protein FN846DRAFT_605200 [Sphaerosporella brunnea]